MKKLFSAIALAAAIAAPAALGLQGVPLGRKPVGGAAAGTHELSMGHGRGLRA